MSHSIISSKEIPEIQQEVAICVKKLVTAIYKIANGQMDQWGLWRAGGAYSNSILVLAIPVYSPVFLLWFRASALHSPLDIRTKRR